MVLSQLAHAAHPRMAAPAHIAARLAWIDNLRALLIAMVVVHHAGQPYDPTGGDWPSYNPIRAEILEPLFVS